MLLTDDLTNSKFPCFENSSTDSRVSQANKLKPVKNNHRMFTTASEIDKTEIQHIKTTEVCQLKSCIETEIEHTVPAAAAGSNPSKSDSPTIYKKKLTRCSEVTRKEAVMKTLGPPDVMLKNRSFSGENFGGNRPRWTSDPGGASEHGDKITQVQLKSDRRFKLSVKSPIGRWGESGKPLEGKKGIPRSKSSDDLVEVSKTRLQVVRRVNLGARIMRSFREKTSSSSSSSRRVKLEPRSVARTLQSSSSGSDDDNDAYEEITAVEETVRMFDSIRMTLVEGKTFLADSLFKRSTLPKIPRLPPPVAPRPPPPEKSKESSHLGKSRPVRHDYLEVISSDQDEDDGCTITRFALADEPGSARTSFCSDSSTWKGEGKEWLLAKDASEIPVDLNIAALTVREVGYCLRLLNMKRYVKKFKRRVVDGAILVTLTEKMLVDSFGMDRLDARKIVMFSQDNWRPCYH